MASVTAAANTDLIDVGYAKIFNNINSQNSDDRIQQLVTACSIKFADETNRSYFLQTKTRTLDGKGGELLQLPDFPLNSISILNVGGVIIPAAVSLNQVGYWFDDDGRVTLVGYRFTRGRKNIQITYNFGYALSGSGKDKPPIAAPSDIQQAVAMMVGFCSDQSKHIQQTSENIGGMVSAYSRDSWPDFVQRTIEQRSRRTWNPA